MIGTDGRLVILGMTTDTVIANPLETQSSDITMTGYTIQPRMIEDKWKTVFFVQFRNAVHQPIVRMVATRTGISDSHAVHIIMTRDTICLSGRKDQLRVTGFAVGQSMLACQSK